MSRKLLLTPILMLGILSFCPEPSQGQFGRERGGGGPPGGFGSRGERGGPPGGFGSRGERGGPPSSFGGPPVSGTMGGPPGGGMMGRGAPDPDRLWDMMGGRGKDSIDINQNPFLKMQYERRGEPIPPGGILTKEQFRINLERRMAEAQNGGGRTSDRERSDRDRSERDRSDPRSFGGPPQGQQWGPPPPSRDDRRESKVEEDARPVVYRYGKMPKEIPSWFEDLDTDRDGMVGLYEWRRMSRPTTEFVKMDLNGDGYLTAQEWLRHQRMELERMSTSEDGSSRGSEISTTSDRGGKGDRSSPTRGQEKGNTKSPWRR